MQRKVLDLFKASNQEATDVVLSEVFPEIVKQYGEVVAGTFLTELMSEIVGAIFPRLNSIRLSYKQNRLESNVCYLFGVLINYQKMLEARLTILESKEETKDFLRFSTELLLDNIVDEIQQSKVSYNVNGYVKLLHTDDANQDIALTFFRTLEKLDLLADGRLKRAGALCFYRKAEKVISGCYVKIGKFEGSDLLYQDEVRGSLLIIADRVIDLIYLKYLKAAISYHKETRVETYPFARDAVREAVFNALIHCNWADNIPIQIRIEEDAMYISNSSMLPFGWTAETLMHSHSSKPFNPDIARVFYRAGYIESWGRGIQKMCDACKTIGADEPEYIVHGGDIMLKFNALQSAKVPESIATKNQNVTKSVTKDVTKEKEILALLREDASMTTTEMAQKLSVNRRTVQRELEKLKKKKHIERKGGRRYGYWEIHE